MKQFTLNTKIGPKGYSCGDEEKTKDTPFNKSSNIITISTLTYTTSLYGCAIANNKR